MKRKKNILIFVIAMMMAFSTITSSYALSDSKETVEQRIEYIYVDSCSSNISYSNSKIVGTVNITGKYSSVTYNGSVSIQRKYGLIWIDIEEWTGLTATRNFVFLNNSITPADGQTYRVKYNVKATYNGSSETIKGESRSAVYNP